MVQILRTVTVNGACVGKCEHHEGPSDVEYSAQLTPEQFEKLQGANLIKLGKRDGYDRCLEIVKDRYDSLRRNGRFSESMVVNQLVELIESAMIKELGGGDE